ncbi:PASTA domain-containing protein [Marinoscillum sp. MHG1-6]|uniref:PASTA domain-containing protein n=1 Tax=Marinoscillum sp. MHG1-6 TaxID=2959627 RepID=UPI0021578A0A|nr:PASTA domain-containing protein [Marinoscillum sp. MHG1-6]
MSKERTWKHLLINLGIITALAITFILVFFYSYLPNITNHGESITVPDVRGLTVDELDDFLGSRNLRFEVTKDSGYSATEKPLSVLKQVPLPDAKVKENRKIYVTLNAKTPPLIRMPKLIEGSVKNATLILQTYDLVLGDIIYVPDRDLNYVLKQQIDGREVMEGEKIPKGSKIDLVAGDGLGQQQLSAPNLIGYDLESAQIAIIGSGLKVGEITRDKENVAVVTTVDSKGNAASYRTKVRPGCIYKQSPTKGEEMTLGQTMDLWVYSPDSIDLAPTILDEP